MILLLCRVKQSRRYKLEHPVISWVWLSDRGAPCPNAGAQLAFPPLESEDWVMVSCHSELTCSSKVLPYQKAA